MNELISIKAAFPKLGATDENGVHCPLCEKCSAQTRYSDRYDSHYCAKCNEWTSQNCGDPECCFCEGRPDKPIKEEL